MQPRILIVYTGGTIGMTEDLSTGALVPFSFDHLMKNVPKIGRLGFNLDHVEMDPPIDSSNMNPACWARIASVRSPTATRTSTASSCCTAPTPWPTPPRRSRSCCPVWPNRWCSREASCPSARSARTVPRTSSRRCRSLRPVPMPAQPMVQEVAISFGRHLWRGNRATKVSSTNFGAFQSFNYPPLADMDLHIVFRERLLCPARCGRVAGAGACHGRCGVGGVSVSRHHRGGAAAPAGIEGREGRSCCARSAPATRPPSRGSPSLSPIRCARERWS